MKTNTIMEGSNLICIEFCWNVRNKGSNSKSRLNFIRTLTVSSFRIFPFNFGWMLIGGSAHCKTFHSGNPMDQIIIHIRLYATHYKFNSLKPFIAEWTNERSIPQNNNYMIFVGGVGDGGVMNSQLASREFWELKWKSRRMKSACFLHRGYEDGFIWVRSWKFVSGGEWFDLYNCGMPNVWNNRY